ncbi:hypothetical protein C8R43DRAFT_974873 [Mycena crocata]|nr:hypothetical protein C8R43DRAFT_974873 [Mycena crocata]
MVHHLATSLPPPCRGFTQLHEAIPVWNSETFYMHPSLRLENLLRLPPTTRRIARAAVNDSPSNIFELHLLVAKKPESETVLFLPVVYLHLDPLGIPTDEQIDRNISGENRAAIVSALFSLMTLADLARSSFFSEALALEFWPRVWPWLEFLWLYSAALTVPQTPYKAYTLYASICLAFGAFAPIAAVQSATPNLFMLLTQAWAILLRLAENEDMFSRLADIVNFINTRRLLDGSHLSDIVDGAGGSLGDLASLLIENIAYIPQFLKLGYSDATIFKFWAATLSFMLAVRATEQSFIGILVSRGSLSGLITGFCDIADYDMRVPSKIMDDIFPNILCAMLECSLGYPGVVIQALKADLLRGILIVGQRAGIQHTHMKNLLHRVLPNALVYHSVLSQLRGSLADVEALSHLQLTLRPGLRKEYAAFVRLATQRIELMQWYDSVDYVSHVACHNIDCGKISRRTDFRRCSACQSVYYTIVLRNARW